MPSRKQEIYCRLLSWGLARIRNDQYTHNLTRDAHRALLLETELLHNLCDSICEPDFVAHDIHFLNVQAQIYFERANPSFCPSFAFNRDAIWELFQLVPDEMRPLLKWTGP